MRIAWSVAIALSLPGILGAEPERSVLLTGRLDAARAERLTAPITSTWTLKLKWLIEEGVAVDQGDAIARFDTSGLSGQLVDTENQLVEREQQRDVQRSDGELQRLDLELIAARAEAEYKKAALDASIPERILEGKDYQQRQLEAARKEQALDDAARALATYEVTLDAALGGLEIDIGRLERLISRLTQELRDLNLHASRPGIVVHEDHPWYGRKVRTGDQIQATFPIASVPDLASLEVEAWAAEADVRRLAVGARAALVLDAFPERQFTGNVVEIGPAGEPRAQWGLDTYFRIRLSIDELDASIMKPGMSVRCVIAERPRGTASVTRTAR